MIAKLAMHQALVPTEDFHTPSIEELFPEPFLFAGTPFAMNRIILVRLIMAALLLTVVFLYMKRAKIVPGRLQGSVEYLLSFCREGISEQIMGKHYAEKYNGLITAIFFSVLFMNLAGIIPGLNVAGTAVVGMPLVLAIIAWVTFVYAGIKAQGGIGFLKGALFPPGVPKILYLMLTPIEFVSTFIVRPFTLFVRLMANMIAGHMLLALALLATNFFLLYAEGTLKIVSVLTFAAAIGFTCFELLVAFLQAYIFAVLTSVYINLSVHSH